MNLALQFLAGTVAACVLTSTPAVSQTVAEYGNVGTKFSCLAPEGFGWMNASFEVGMEFLSPAQLAALRALQPPPAK